MTTCLSCGRESDEGFRFCPHCGAPLDPGPAEPPRTQRRIVTVVFADLVGFTTRSDRADPEDVRAILAPFHAIARAEIEGHGGTLDKFIGDAAMGVWGSPVAHEDDPERAVRAALRIMKRVPELNAGRPGNPFDVRVGVNTGEAAVTLAAGVQEGENVAGDVVNTAARLQSAAQPGSILVGEATHAATERALDYDRMPDVTAKGKAEPLRVWRPHGARTVGGATPERPGAGPFLGRDPELASLEAAFERTVAGPHLELVTVLGEPGVGKSRLVAEFAALAGRRLQPAPARVLRGRCLAYGEGITFWALAEIVKGWAGILETDASREREAKLAAAVDASVPDPDERTWVRSRLGPLAGLEPGVPVERPEAFAAWRRALEAVAANGPLVLVFEDLHWADPALLAFLDDVVDHAAARPILVVGTARPELAERRPVWCSGDGDRRHAIALRPLDDAQTDALLTGLAPGGTLSSGTRAALLERAAGNPLYAEELLRVLRDRGILGSGALPAGELEFPPTIQALIAARLDTLRPELRSLLHDASVIGRGFWSGAVAALSGEDEALVRTRLEELAGRELVRVVAASTMRGQAQYRFWHALVRDVVYGQIPRAERAAKHRTAADWIERMAGDHPEDVAEILVHHLTSALDLLRASGKTEGLDALTEASARNLRLAATRTMALDVERAEQQLRRAAELLPEEHPDRPAVLAALGEAILQLGNLEEADRVFARAIEGLRANGAELDAADAMVRRSVVLEYRAEPSAGWELLAEAIATLERLPPGRQLARAYATAAGSAMVWGRFGEGLERADRALALAGEVGEPQAAARAHAFRGFGRVILGDEGGIEEQRAALEALIGLGMGRAAGVAYNNLGSALILTEGPRPALDVLREGEAFAEGHGVREMATAIRNSMLTALNDLGEWDEVLRLGAAVAEAGRDQGSVYDEVYADADLAYVRAWRSGADALGQAEATLARARALEDPPLVQSALVAAAVARRAAGDLDGVAALVREAVDATQGEGVATRLLDLHHLARLAVEAGDAALAERALEGTEGHDLGRYRRARLGARAVVLEAASDAESALGAFREAVAGWGEWDVILEEAHALEGTARCLERLGRPDEAAPPRAAAAELFGRLGVTR